MDEAFFLYYSAILSGEMTEEELQGISDLPEDLFFDRPDMAARYRRLYEHCEENRLALLAISLYFLALLDERSLALLREGLGLREGLTMEAVGQIALRGHETICYIPELREAFGYIDILLQADPATDWLKSPFQLDGRLAAYLRGDDSIDPSLARHCLVHSPYEENLPPPCFTAALLTEHAAMLQSARGFRVVSISGERHSGRRFLAKHLAASLRRPLLEVPLSFLIEQGTLQQTRWRKVLRELMLSERLLLLTELPVEELRLPEMLRELVRDAEGLGRLMFVTGQKKAKVLPFLDCYVQSIAIPEPSILESARLWETFAAQYLTEPAALPAMELAAKMTLTAGQIARTVQLLSEQSPKGPYEARDIFRLCYQVLDDGKYENIRFVATNYTWDDLKLEPQLKEKIRAICGQVEHQGLVLDSWGLRRKFPYGRCVSVLFSGPPGTGKTMAAQVLSSQLGLELYQVDLSQIVDKYIGETEKRLGQVFDQAEKSNMILFFDEADALLGKRSEVKEAKDKYANTEVSYLLQRIEEYSGITIMATNQAGNMDPAFLRRFRYHLVFTPPNESLRRDLWEDVLGGIPSEGIAWEYLPRQFELTGAQIKNIALNAAYQAARSGGILRMAHLVQAIFEEQQKEGKILLTSDFGEYGILLSDYLNGQKR